MIDVVILFFIFGLTAGLVRSDLKLPAALYDSLSLVRIGECCHLCMGSNWLMTRNIAFEPQSAIFLTVMEIPAIMVGIILARGIGRQTDWRSLAHETFLGKGVTLLIGGMAIGWAAGL